MAYDGWRAAAIVVAIFDMTLLGMALTYVVVMGALADTVDVNVNEAKMWTAPDFSRFNDTKIILGREERENYDAHVIFLVTMLLILVLFVLSIIASIKLLMAALPSSTAEESLSRSMFWYIVNGVVTVVGILYFFQTASFRKAILCVNVRGGCNYIVYKFTQEMLLETEQMPNEINLRVQDPDSE